MSANWSPVVPSVLVSWTIFGSETLVLLSLQPPQFFSLPRIEDHLLSGSQTSTNHVFHEVARVWRSCIRITTLKWVDILLLETERAHPSEVLAPKGICCNTCNIRDECIFIYRSVCNNAKLTADCSSTLTSPWLSQQPIGMSVWSRAIPFD